MANTTSDVRPEMVMRASYLRHESRDIRDVNQPAGGCAFVPRSPRVRLDSRWGICHDDLRSWTFALFVDNCLMTAGLEL